MKKIVQKFGKRTANIISGARAGLTTKQIAARYHVRNTVVRATVANFSRGVYSSYLD